MAADGDMYAQRKAWGFNRLCAAARDHAPVEKLVEIEKKSVRNMLSNVPDNSSANILSNYEEQAITLDRAFKQTNPWQVLASDFPELYEMEQAIIDEGQHETGVREALLQLLKTQVGEWKTFSGRETLHRFLLAA